MKCKKCGYENDCDAQFCENCGEKLTQICVNCSLPLKPGTSYCKNCGTPVSYQHPSSREKDRLAQLQQAAPSDLLEKMRLSSTKLDGERKPVTILFTDIVGSTALAEKLDPEEWKEVVSGAHQRVIQVVYRYEGTIAQLLGDGVLAFFGAPVTHENDPIRAVRAALDIQQTITKYADELKGYIDTFQMRIGINSGTVVVGQVGSDMHMEYLAIGDAVNLAARLQSAAQPGGILISEATARLVRASIELEAQGAILVKGKAEPVAVYKVIRGKVAPEGGRGFEELYSQMVGRETELGLLRSALDALLKGHGQILTIFGEAGIGKSRLVEEARKHIPDICTALHWIEGRAVSYGQTLSFWMIIQFLYSDLGLSDDDPEVKVRTALKRRIIALFAEQADEVLPYLGHLLGITLEPELSERLRQLDGKALKHQTLLAISRYFQKLAENQPTVIGLDDLQWVDPSSLEALEQILQITDRAPLMLIILSRPEREHNSWGLKLRAETIFAHRYTEIFLKPLSESDQSKMIDGLLAVIDLPDSIRHVILERAEGNPFYLEEIVRSLIEQGAFVPEGGERHSLRTQAVKELSDISIPDTLQGLLLARIDRLQDDVRYTLQLASVIGKNFLYRLLKSILHEQVSLEQHLSQLQRVDLVREKTRLPELEYMFKHSLTQEAAYNSLLLERRREFHLRIGEALEQLFTDRKEQYLGLLAHHFEHAHCTEKAVHYYTQAGKHAARLTANQEAISYFNHALASLKYLPPSDQRDQMELDLQLSLGPPLTAVKGWAPPEMEIAYARAQELCLNITDTSRLHSALWLLATFRLGRSEHTEVDRLVARISEIAEKGDDPAFQAMAYVQVSPFYQGRLRETSRLLDPARSSQDIALQHSVAQRYGMAPAAVGLAYFSNCLWLLGYPDQADQINAQAAEMAELIDHPLTTCYVLSRSCWFETLKGNSNLLITLNDKLLNISQKYSFKNFEIAAVFFKNKSAIDSGESANQFIEAMHQAIEAYAATNTILNRTAFLVLFAQSCQKAGQRDRGLTAINESIDLGKRTGELWFQAEAWRTKGELLILKEKDVQSKTAQSSEAETCFKTALQIATHQEAKSFALRAAMSLTRLRQAQGKLHGSHKVLSTAYNWFTEGFNTADLQDARALLDSLR